VATQPSNAQNPKRKITWAEFEALCTKLGHEIANGSGVLHRIDSIWGVPTGGSFVARELVKYLSLPMVDQPGDRTLIVDDIVDSGRTLSGFSNNPTAALHVKPHSKVRPHAVVEETRDWIVYPWEKDTEIESSISRILEYIGEDPHREGLIATPKRVVKSWSHLFSGYAVDPQMVLKTQFTEAGADEVIICKNIEMYSTCEHHMLPFYGKASVGYIPRDGRIVGLSKLARIVEVFSRRLQNQERITRQVAEAIQQALNPVGVAVVIEADHFCMRARGVEKQNSKMVTSCMLGAFRDEPEARAEFLRLIER
jgi:GTP cyclohydrolase IA